MQLSSAIDLPRMTGIKREVEDTRSAIWRGTRRHAPDEMKGSYHRSIARAVKLQSARMSEGIK
jgi:hypothetical protein